MLLLLLTDHRRILAPRFTLKQLTISLWSPLGVRDRRLWTGTWLPSYSRAAIASRHWSWCCWWWSTPRQRIVIPNVILQSRRITIIDYCDCFYTHSRSSDSGWIIHSICSLSSHRMHFSMFHKHGRISGLSVGQHYSLFASTHRTDEGKTLAEQSDVVISIIHTVILILCTVWNQKSIISLSSWHLSVFTSIY